MPRQLQIIIIISALIGALILAAIFGVKTIEGLANADGTPRMITDNIDIADHYDRQRPTHAWLDTILLSGKPEIVNLKPHNPAHTNYAYVGRSDKEGTSLCVKSAKYYKMPKTISPELARQIVKYQPEQYGDKPHLISVYGQPHYRDWRYPERPISIKFLTDGPSCVEPLKYPYVCSKN